MPRFVVTTALLLCHGLSRLLWAAPIDHLGSTRAQTGAAPLIATAANLHPSAHRAVLPAGTRLRLGNGGTVTVLADQLTVVRGVYTLSGNVEIDYGDLRLVADRMRYDRATGIAVAAGHVAFDSQSETTHIEGARAQVNFQTRTGEFDDFQGVSGMRMRGRGVTLLSNNPLIFSGRRLLRLGEKKYRIDDGTVTSCRLPHPKWTLSARRVEFELGENARLYDGVFRLKGVPLFYAPYLTHSTQRAGRHSGFLVPTVGHNNRKGTVLGDSFFWAPNRSVGAQLGAEYFTQRGWADHLALDSRPSQNSDLRLQVDGVLDRGIPALNGTARIRQGGQESSLLFVHEAQADTGISPTQVAAEHPFWNGFRTVVDANYLSSFVYRLAFKESFADAINSEVISTGFTERQHRGYSLSAGAHRYQNFLSTRPHDKLSLVSAPSFDFSSLTRPLGNSLQRRWPLYVAWDVNASSLDRLQPGFSSGLLERFDVAPQITIPFTTPLGTMTALAGVRSTYYSRRLASAGSLAPAALGSGGLERYSGSVDLTWNPPAVARIFETPGGLLDDRLKHVVEPEVAYHYTAGVRNFGEIIQFDDRDLLTNTNELEFSLTNRLLGRSTEQAHARELGSWTLRQKYFFDPSFGGALVPGGRNIFLTTALLTPFAFDAQRHGLSPLTSVVRIAPFAAFDGDWRLDVDANRGAIAASAFTGNFHLGKTFFSGTHFLIRTPQGLLASNNPLTLAANGQTSFNQLRFSTGYGNPQEEGFSGAIAAAYDAHQGLLQYTTVQTTYNWDCCGFAIQYRRFALASVRRENQFRVAFTLANVGSFGNLKRQERIY